MLEETSVAGTAVPAEVWKARLSKASPWKDCCGALVPDFCDVLLVLLGALPFKAF